MADEIVLSQEIETGISQKVDPVELAKNIYPRIERALQLAVTPQETNEIRAQLETVNTYIQRSIPKVIKDRTAQFYYTHEGEMLYLRASEKAGALWKVCEEKMPVGRNWDNSENFPNKLSVLSAGFKNSRDATSCERISELHEEDWRTYEEETSKDMKQATLSGLEKIWQMNNVEEPPPIPIGKYRIIYADPPWKYGDQLIDGYGAAEHHYPTMTIDQLCELPIKELGADNSVLFMWVTSPVLDECFEVIRSWGYHYKASFIWDKVKHNYGHYNSVRHEILLLCTRGSCLPDNSELFDSVQQIERSDEHSKKPQEFRSIIENLYTSGPKIELFARGEYDGWKTWGNE